MAGDDLGLDMISVIWLTLALLICNMYMNCVTALILIIFGESIARLCGWCKRLEQNVDELLGTFDPGMIAHCFVDGFSKFFFFL